MLKRGGRRPIREGRKVATGSGKEQAARTSGVEEERRRALRVVDGHAHDDVVLLGYVRGLRVVRDPGHWAPARAGVGRGDLPGLHEPAVVQHHHLAARAHEAQTSDTKNDTKNNLNIT